MWTNSPHLLHSHMTEPSPVCDEALIKEKAIARFSVPYLQEVRKQVKNKTEKYKEKAVRGRKERGEAEGGGGGVIQITFEYWLSSGNTETHRSRMVK